MFLLIVLIVLAAIFVRGAFRIILPILLSLLLLRMFIGAVFWLLSPQFLIPALILAVGIWIGKLISDRRRRSNQKYWR
ncbi:hypothetical protein [Lactovum miscens]|uniref:Phage shock protein G n=1 Tax=Lactovum miscens TaxID=190387 RepID=A0A841C8G8_9LACT|nr:hypothetical protein [Lactovum miscens]MBB5887841.1 hypothetical protein [Lactovum miscens]